MPVPTFDCPVCRTTLTWDVVFAHQGVREAILVLVNAHPEGGKLLRPLLQYIGLWAPAKTAMRYDRIVILANELVTMIRTAQVERRGRAWAAPMAYWQQAMEEVVDRSHRGALRTPLSSHGYLLEILVGYAEKAEAGAETRTEQQRAGHAGAGTPEDRKAGITQGPVVLDASLPKRQMPEHVREQLQQLTKGKKS